MILHITVIALMAIVTGSSAQWQNQNPSGGCNCPSQYIPFCATDGRREITFRNKCEMDCARKGNPGLRKKFEGVCAEPYKQDLRGSKNLDGSSDSWGWQSNSIQTTTRRPYTTTRRTYYPTTRKTYYTTQRPTTRQPYYPPPVSSVRPGWSSPGNSAYPRTIPTTNTPWWSGSGRQNRGAEDDDDDNDSNVEQDDYQPLDY